LCQDPLDLLSKGVGSLRALKPPDLLTFFVKQDKRRRTDTAVLARKLLSCTASNVYANDPELRAILILKPAHDGLHLLADLSVVGKKVQHAGAVPLTALDGLTAAGKDQRCQT
jgi:hypothetical protein